MLTGWQALPDSGDRRLDDEGNELPTHWYYFSASGAMQTDKWIGNYYVTSSGAMATNTWIGKYHVNASGLWDQTR